jgi:hypothetical protein
MPNRSVQWPSTGRETSWWVELSQARLISVVPRRYKAPPTTAKRQETTKRTPFFSQSTTRAATMSGATRMAVRRERKAGSAQFASRRTRTYSLPARLLAQSTSGSAPFKRHPIRRKSVTTTRFSRELGRIAQDAGATVSLDLATATPARASPLLRMDA